MKSTFIAITLLMLGAAMAQDAAPYSVQTCAGTSESLLHIATYEVDGTIKAGSTVTVKATGTNFQTATVASAYIKAYADGIKVYTGTQPVGMTVEKGPFNFSQSLTLPKGIPRGKYKARVILKDASGNQLQCFDATAHLG
jgi:hypothetical protein